eukprot:tig00000194_g14806.t1
MIPQDSIEDFARELLQTLGLAQRWDPPAVPAAVRARPGLVKLLHRMSSDPREHVTIRALALALSATAGKFPKKFAPPPISAKALDQISGTPVLDAATLRVCGNASRRRPSCVAREPKPRAFAKCSGCKQVWYCTDECQKAAWKEHKPRCKELRRAFEEAAAKLQAPAAAAEGPGAAPETAGARGAPHQTAA